MSLVFIFLQGPFTTFRLQQDKDRDWTGLKFSSDGKLILISTSGAVVRSAMHGGVCEVSQPWC